ncbi:MAG: tripartite tricarboxylate transporter substrate binding protein [Burkholderiales bacterium]|nr:tripartite tricarboxylate transporter substrate binding protein [Burkholderiales bacterium]
MRRFPGLASRGVSIVCSAAAAGVAAQTKGGGSAAPAAFPTKPVRMVVPLAPGGGSDIVGRIVAQALSAHWGQTVVVDNRPGAGGTIGNTIVARSAPDGYTMLVSSSTMAISPSLIKNQPSDIVKDFQPITLLASQPSIIAIHPKVPANSLKELVELMKAQPGKFAFGSAGNGTASHLANEQFAAVAGVKTLHVPYKSAGLATTALLAGELQFMVTNMATALPQVKAGRLKGLAVTGTQRVPSVPDLPTAAEAGLQGYEYSTWYAMLLPVGAPRVIVTKIHADTINTIRHPEIKERFAAQGLDVHGNTPEEFGAYLRAEVAKWGGVVQVAGLTVK